MSIISMILVVIVAFLAGIEGVVDEFQFHQPLVACTLIGLVTGNLEAGIVLGGSLQMIALGWANIGAAVAPDAALASVASAIILVLGGQGVKGVSTAIAVAIPLAVAGLFLTMVVRTLSVFTVWMLKLKKQTSRVLNYGTSLPSVYRDFVLQSRQHVFLQSLLKQYRTSYSLCLHG